MSVVIKSEFSSYSPKLFNVYRKNNSYGEGVWKQRVYVNIVISTFVSTPTSDKP